MDEKIFAKVEFLEKKIDRIYESVEKTRRYFLYTFIAAILSVLLPIILAMYELPKFIDTYSKALDI